MTMDWTIGIGNILEITAMIIGGMMVLMTLKTDVNALKEGAANLKQDFEYVQKEIEKLGEILVNLENIRGEMRVLSSRVANNETDIREIRQICRSEHVSFLSK